MSKFKDLENKVAALEEEIKELRAQLLSLALQPRGATAPFVVPSLPPATPNVLPLKIGTEDWQWKPSLPYIGDDPNGGTVTISCHTQKNQNMMVGAVHNVEKEHS